MRLNGNLKRISLLQEKDAVNLSQKVCDHVHDKESVRGTILKFSVVIIIR